MSEGASGAKKVRLGRRSSSASATCSPASRASSPAASASGSRSPARIVREPTVFLLDEPLSNLDAKLRASAREELEQFQKRVGTTTIYVTHDQVEAMAMGDRIVVMNQGVVRQIGTPARGLRRPGRHLRRDVPRLAADEPRRGRGRHRRVPAGALRPRRDGSTAASVAGPPPHRARRVPRLRADPATASSRAAASTGSKVVSRVATDHERRPRGGRRPRLRGRRASDLKFFDRATGKRCAPRELSWR